VSAAGTGPGGDRAGITGSGEPRVDTLGRWESGVAAPADAPLRLADLEALAAARMSPGVMAYYSGAANDEVTLADNLAAFRRWRFVPRMGAEIEGRDASVEVLGRRWPAPFMVAPMALHRMADPDGELAVARACASRGLVMSLSTVGTATIEEVAAAGAAAWFQLYLLRDPGRNRELLDRAAAAGYEAVVLTMDAPILGRRERDLRTGFRLPDGIAYANIRRGALKRGDTYGDDDLKPSNTWDDLARVVGATTLPVVVKGVLHPDDARRALDLGAAAVDVSNHGGRQLDGTIAALDALPAVVDAVAGRAPVLLDSGIRRGSDILAALALGARAVMLGRPVLWALAWNGEAGVGHALDLLRAELELAMGLAGVTTPSEATRDLLVRVPG
jgi:4-hydroxymandelate oxidase